jgi:transcription termination factor Rho
MTTESANDAATRAALTAMRLPQLQAIASQLGVKGISRMRKSDLLAAIRAHSGGAGDNGSAPKTGADNGAGRQRARSASTPRTTESAESPRSDASLEQHDAGESGQRDSGQRHSGQRDSGQRDSGRRDAGANETTHSKVTHSEATHSEVGQADPGQQSAGRSSHRQESAAGSDQQPSSGDQPSEADRNGRPRETERRRARRVVSSETGERTDESRDGQTRDNQSRDNQTRDNSNRDQNRDTANRDSQNREQSRDANQNRHQQNRQNTPRDDDDDEGGGRRRRSRYRDRKRRGRGGDPMGGVEEPEVTDDDVLVPVAGILDVLDSYAFVRTSGYLPGPGDVYVSLGQVRKNGLRKGDQIVGAVRQPKDDQQYNGQGNRPKFNALVRLDTVNDLPPEEARRRPEFGKLTPLYPQQRLRLETEANIYTTRVIDLVAPIGKGQRALIVSPPKAGKTMVMQAIANAITTNNPECHLMVVLVDERPEEVTDFSRSVKGEVIASTFDRPAVDHTMIAELAIERAKRLVEMGHDVVVLLDGITRLGRAYNLAAPASGRIMSGGVDSSALYPPKKFFGAARNIEGGGSLTIIATALVETGSKMDDVIFEEFKGTGNCELRLNRSLADKRVFPAVDVNPSGTRKEEILVSREELALMWKLRRVLAALDTQQALELLLGKLRDTRSNAEFLMQVAKTTPMVLGRDDD